VSLQLDTEIASLHRTWGERRGIRQQRAVPKQIGSREILVEHREEENDPGNRQQWNQD
jgi:hypothetical protein